MSIEQIMRVIHVNTTEYRIEDLNFQNDVRNLGVCQALRFYLTTESI
uniref:Uncharacterized protein n=1 Tax=Anguilla anguilla TaxID=7936 RepID=A0A0E9RR26_ANGAN